MRKPDLGKIRSTIGRWVLEGSATEDDYQWLGQDDPQGRKCDKCDDSLQRWEILNGQTLCWPCFELTIPLRVSQRETAERAAEEILARCGVPPAYQLFSIDNWRGGVPPEFAEFVNAPRGPWYLYGESGRGKSHLAVSAILRIIQQHGSTWCLYANCPTLIGELRRDLGTESSNRRIETLRDCQVLVLDDLGSERGTEWSQETLGEVIHYRHLQDKPLVVTSNLSPVQLHQLEPRIKSRLCSGLVTHLTGKDRRY